MWSRKDLNSFKHNEAGAQTIWNAAMLIGILSIGGLAVDSSNAWRVKTLLQNTAEASALAAALYIDDPQKAKSTAVEFAQLNMPQNVHGQVISDADVQLGVFDKDTRVFTPTSDNPDAVRVLAGRNTHRQNAVTTYLLRFIGVNQWDMGRSAIAFPSWANGQEIDCSGAIIVTSGHMDVGGDNTLVEGVCIHGENGVDVATSDYMNTSVKFSAARLLDIVIAAARPGSAQPEALKRAQSKDLSILPTLDYRFAELWNTLYETQAQTYSGALLPPYIFKADGTANVVQINGDWRPRGSDIDPHTIYMVDGNVQTGGTRIDMSNIAIIATGNIRTGNGGPEIKDVFFFAEGDLNFTGAVSWGDKDNYCDSGAYNTYLLSKSYLFLGGKSAYSHTRGVLGVAPNVNVGGGLNNVAGIYLEMDTTATSLGGGIEIQGSCDDELASMYKTTPFSVERMIIGSSLRR